MQYPLIPEAVRGWGGGSEGKRRRHEHVGIFSASPCFTSEERLRFWNYIKFQPGSG